MLKEHQDAYGQEVYAYLTQNSGYEIVEREDGYITCSAGPAAYFAPFENWPTYEQAAMQYVHGRVLDVGCGAGRVGLYLQEQGHEVLGIDNSPLALEVCKRRGLSNTSLTPITKISSRLGVFDTVVMLGNNFGLFGSFERARRLLTKLHRLTSPYARIIAESNNIYQTEDPVHLDYQAYNRQRGRMSGQLRIRVRFKKYTSPWFDYLLVAPSEMSTIIEDTGWCIGRFIESPNGPIYIAVIEKVGTAE